MTVDLEHLEIMDPIDIPFVNSDAEGPPGTVSWVEVTGKPATFPPSAHTHAQQDVDNLVDEINSLEAAVANLDDLPDLVVEFENGLL
jgi:hypothetical protein